MKKIKNEIDYLNHLYENDVVWKRDHKGKLIYTMKTSLDGEEKPLKGIYQKRSHNGLECLEIDLGRQMQDRVCPDRCSPILLNGDVTQQVGAVHVMNEDRGILQFSRSADGRTAQRLVARGKLKPFVAFKDYGNGRQPVAISLRTIKSDGQKKGKNEMSDNEAILDLASKYNQPNMAIKAIRDGHTLDQFRGDLLDVVENKSVAMPNINTGSNQTFSLSRLIRAEINNDYSQAGYEREVCQEEKKNYIGTPRGLIVPQEALLTRTSMLSSGDIAGAIGTQLLASKYIDIARATSSVMNAGATMIPGLNSNIAIPKNNSDVSATFIAEGSAITESDIDVDTITLTPKLCAGTASFSKQVLQTTSPKVDELVQEGLQLQIMNRIDDSALNGNGSAPNPTGVANTTGINTKVTAGNSTMTHAESLEIIASVASNNLDTSGGVFLLHPNDAATIGSTSKDSGSGTFVYENGLIAGKRVIETTHATEGTAFFGIFRHLMIGMFGGLDIVIDPYSSSRSGIVHITATQLTDVAVAYEKAFSKITLTA